MEFKSPSRKRSWFHFCHQQLVFATVNKGTGQARVNSVYDTEFDPSKSVVGVDRPMYAL